VTSSKRPRPVAARRTATRPPPRTARPRACDSASLDNINTRSSLGNHIVG
jgi:hypothetical protein